MSEINKHFTQEFNQELFVAFQNKGGVMRGRLRRKTGVVGERTHFPKIGLAPVAQPKTRHGLVPVMDIARDRVSCDLTDMFASTLLEDMDQLKTNVEEKGAVQSALAMSLARSEDDIALGALAASTNPANSLGADDTFSSDTVPRTMMEVFGNNEAIDGGNMHALVSWRAWNDLLALNSFVNSDYGGDSGLTTEGMRPKTYFGFHYMAYSRLTRNSGKPVNIWFNPNCAGTAVGKEITPETVWRPEIDSWQIKGKMSQGGVMIESTGVVQRRYAA